MAHGGAAEIGALLGAAGVPLVLAFRGRVALLAGLVVLAAAEALLAVGVVPAEDLRLLWETPLHVAAAGVAAAVVAGVGILLARRPAVAPVALVAVAPFRVPIELGGQRAFLLLPLYAVLAGAALALAWRAIRGAPVRSLPATLAVPASVLLALSAISLLWSADPRAGTIQLLFFLFPFAVLLAAIGRAPLEEWTARAAGATVVALGLVFAVVGIWQVWTKRVFFAPDIEVTNAYTSFFRVTSLFKDPSLYGRYLVIAIAVALVALWRGHARAGPVAAVVAVLAAGLYFSYSQSSFVTLFVVVLAGTLLAANRLARRAAVATAAICLLLGIVVVAVTVRGESARVATSARSSLAATTVEVFARNPVVGVGIGGHAVAARDEAGGATMVRRNVSHTTPLTAAAENGVFGIVAYLLFLAGAAATILLLRRRDEPLGLALGLVALALFVHSLFYSGFFEDAMLWAALGIAAAALTAPAAVPVPPLRELWRSRRARALAVAGAAMGLAMIGAGAAMALTLREPEEGKLDTKLEGVSVIRPAPQTEAAPAKPDPPPQKETRPRPPVDRRCWLQFGGGPMRRLARTDIKLGKPTRSLWARGLRGYVEYPPVYCEGTLYVNTYRGDTFAVDALTGKVVWRQRGGRKPASPALAGPRVIVSSKDGTVTAFQRKTGRLDWRVKVDSGVESSPVVVDKTTYFGAHDGRVFGVDVRNGRVRWAFDTGGRINSSPAVVGNRVCVTTYAGSIFCLDRRNGRKLWSRDFKRDTFRFESFYASASSDGTRLFTVARSGRVYAVSVANGRRLWRQRVGGLGYSTPAVANGRVFVGGFDGYLRAFRSTTGRLLWRRHVRGRILGGAVVVGNLVFVSSLEQRTFALDVATGRIVWQIGMGKYSPAIATENHYYMSLNGILVAFRAERTPKRIKRAEDVFFRRPATARGGAAARTRTTKG